MTQCKTTKVEGVNGRSVTKNKYEAEYDRAQSQTEAYAAIRQEHPAIERKLNEILNHHRGRRARYWGKAKVKQQETMTSFAIHVKRILKIVLGEVCLGMKSSGGKQRSSHENIALTALRTQDSSVPAKTNHEPRKYRVPVDAQTP